MRGSYAMQRNLQAIYPHWGFNLPGDERRTVCQFLDDLANVLPFVVPAGQEDRIMHSQRRKALVDDPSEGPDAGTHEILLQLGRLVNRRGLGKRDDQHASELRVTEAGE